MHRVPGLIVLCMLVLSSCTQKLICPAYQSAFIYDQDALRKKFSYFKEDSTPKILTVSKDRYLMIPEKSYRAKIRALKTVEMKPVYVVLPDSLKPGYKKGDGDQLTGAEMDSATFAQRALAADSSTARIVGVEDSVYQITKDKETRVLKYDRDSAKYRIEHITLNSDQDAYMWYFRDVLVLPDVRAALQDQKNAKGSQAKEAKKKKGVFGFFRNLFKKKPKADSTQNKVVQPPPIDSDDPADSTAALEATPVITPPPPEKKGIGGFFKNLFKKKPRQPKKEPEPVINPTEKTEDKPAEKKDPAKKEGDGF